jgi:U3 small nucleolar RNA-associated protein 14
LQEKSTVPKKVAKKTVIVSERRDKKFSSKYLVAKCPHPFQSKEQYEASIRLPVGKEWNTVQQHQKFTKPRVLTTTGAVIQPLKFVEQPKDKKERK